MKPLEKSPPPLPREGHKPDPSVQLLRLAAAYARERRPLLLIEFLRMRRAMR